MASSFFFWRNSDKHSTSNINQLAE